MLKLDFREIQPGEVMINKIQPNGIINVTVCRDGKWYLVQNIKGVRITIKTVITNT